MNSSHGLLNCEIGGLDSVLLQQSIRSRVHCIHM